jgi:hypothetical protein
MKQLAETYYEFDRKTRGINCQNWQEKHKKPSRRKGLNSEMFH